MTIDHYQKVKEAWGDKALIAARAIPKDRAVDVAKSIYQFMFGKSFQGEIKLTSGRRYTWVRRGVLFVNPDFKQSNASGWAALVHDLSHYGHARINPKNDGHGRVHAEFEAEIARYVVKKYLGSSTFVQAPSVEAPKPVRRDPVRKDWSAMKRVKKLLATHPSIEVEKDNGDFWVYCSAFDPDEDTDPLYDAHFATTWDEVLDSVTVYVEALGKL